MLDFDSVRFAALVPVGDSLWTWAPGDDLSPRRVRFGRDGSGAVVGFAWVDTSGVQGTARRARRAPFDVENVTFTSADSTRLAGSILVPRVRKLVGSGAGSMREVPIMLPAAVIIQGSGASDRDNVWAYHIAQHLARSGVVVLLPDKRGSGASQGDWHDADFDDLADDALAAVERLRRHPMADPDRVGLVGLSQGGWIAPLAASREARVAFVIDVSGAAVTPARQVRHELAQDLREAGLSDNLAGRVLALVDLADAYARTMSDADWRAYDARRESLLNGPLADAIAPFPHTRDHWRWSWWSRVLDFDPIPAWRDIGRPAVVVYGGQDERDNVPVEESVQLLRDALSPERYADRTVRVFTDAGHALTDDSGWIDPDFLAFIAGWIREHVGQELDRPLDRPVDPD